MRTLALLITLGLVAADESAPVIRYGKPVLAGQVEDARITESSGLCPGVRNRDALWTINDSGNEPLIFALDMQGRTRGVFHPAPIENIDWEDMASCTLDGTAWLVVADVGDNQRRRQSIAIYLVPEPDLTEPHQAAAPQEVRGVRSIRFTYDDGSHDCEAVAVDGERRKVYLVVKELFGNAGVYELDLPADRTPPPLDGARDRLKAKRVASIPVPLATGMSISPDNRRAVVTTYGDAYEFYRTADESWPDAFNRPPRRLPMPPRQQGESICYASDGSALYLTSEKTPTPLWKVPVVTPH